MKKRMKKMMSLVMMAALSASLLTGCGGNDKDKAPKEGSEKQARTDFNISSSEILDSTDPHMNTRSANATTIGMLYEGFYFVTNDVQLEPRLAEDYTVSEDKKTYEYKLRKGVKFHNGDEMKASDVVFSFERAMQSAPMYSLTQHIESVTALDDYTVQIKLKEVYAPFYIDVNGVKIVSEKACTEAGDDFATKPCGTGPYVISEWNGSEKVTFKLFDDYYRKKFNMETVNISVITDPTSALMAFEAGDLDYIGVPKAEWSRIQESDKYGTLELGNNNTAYIIYNTEREPFNDVRVRQAINYALNKEEILLGAMEGMGKIAYTIGDPEYTLGIPEASEVMTYEQDKDKARELLKEAGYENGLTIPGKFITVAGHLSKAAEIIQRQLEEVGIHVEIETMEQSAYATDCLSGNYDIGLMQAAMGNDFAGQERMFTTQFINDFNIARYSNPEVDELFKLGATTLDQEERNEYYRQVVDITNKDAVYAPLYWMVSSIAYNKDLQVDVNRPFYEWDWKE